MPSNNKRIAKNTLMLYIRMLITILISLYTSRIVLFTLGVSDYGIYTIVGSVVVLFSFLNNAMSSATIRFLSFEIGRKDFERLRKTFCISMNVHFSIAILVLILAETIGLWFVNTQLNIPLERMNAVNWVYQFTIFTFIISIIQVPYNATILANEKMSFYAYISIIEVTLKLCLVFLLQKLAYDKLKLYAVLMFLVALIVITIYKIYCSKKFASSRYRYYKDLSLYKQLLSFSGWSLFESGANVSVQVSLNYFFNIFYGVTLNAAMGIANQVSNAVYGFVSNFQTAFNPQIVKSYASNDRKYFMYLIFQSSRFSYYLLLLLSIPVIICTEFILQIWLHNVPPYTASFCRIMIIYLLIDSLSAPLWMSVKATGKIRNYQILISSLIILNLPFMYLVLKLGFSPVSVLLIRVSINSIAYLVRIVYLRNLIEFPASKYIREVILVVTLVTILALPLPLIVNHYNANWIGLIATSATALISTGLSVYFVGLKRNERKLIIGYLISVFQCPTK